jgi:hypothetical protein
MKVRFYPRNIGLWRGLFNFDTILTSKQCQDFHDRAELIEWLKSNGARLDDVEYPLEFRAVDADDTVYKPRGITHAVVQWTLIGWIAEGIT